MLGWNNWWRDSRQPWIRIYTKWKVPCVKCNISRNRFLLFHYWTIKFICLLFLFWRLMNFCLVEYVSISAIGIHIYALLFDGWLKRTFGNDDEHSKLVNIKFHKNVSCVEIDIWRKCCRNFADPSFILHFNGFPLFPIFTLFIPFLGQLIYCPDGTVGLPQE